MSNSQPLLDETDASWHFIDGIGVNNAQSVGQSKPPSHPEYFVQKLDFAVQTWNRMKIFAWSHSGTSSDAVHIMPHRAEPRI